MVSIREIIESNRKTFFDHRLNRHESISGRIIVQAALSLVLAALFYRGLAGFLGGVITVQAILIGFSFSVMFFLASSSGEPKTTSQSEEDSIEATLRRDQAVKVGGEMFSNLAYFNLVCLFCLTVALVLMLPPLSASFPSWAVFAPDKLSGLSHFCHWAGYFFWGAFVWLFYFLLVESTFTFVRITGRINFLFSEKIRP